MHGGGAAEHALGHDQECRNVEQQAVLGLLRVRQGFIEERTATINRLRGLLAEFGVVIGQSPAAIERALSSLLADADRLPPLAHRCARALHDHVRELEARIAEFDRDIAQHVKTSEWAGKTWAVKTDASPFWILPNRNFRSLDRPLSLAIARNRWQQPPRLPRSPDCLYVTVCKDFLVDGQQRKI